jgi:hypothetical protein
MFLKKFFPLIIAGYMAVVGIIFLTLPFFHSSPAFLDSPSKIILRVISALLVCAGVLSIYFFQKKKLKKEGKTIIEVRTETVGKLKSESLLASIALNDPNPQIRATARQRLDALNINWPAVRLVSD